MNKRLLIILVYLLCAGTFIFSDVVVKDIDGTNVEIIITYKDDEASEVNVIGSFNAWLQPGEAMEKNADGLWEYTLPGVVDDEIIYKFFYDDNWITDPNAPETKDDGFAGLNGLIIVADLLQSQNIKVTDVSEPIAFKSKLNFGMYTIIGSKSSFSTQGVVDKTDKGLEMDTTGFSAKSYIKLGGDIVPDVNMWFELKAFESYQPIWGQDARGIITTEADDGIAALVGGLVTNPINYAGGSNPSLNSVKLGLDSPFVNIETGYGYAKPQGRTALLWETIGERDANNGYMRFDLGDGLKTLGPATIEATIAPNVMAGNYGLFSWIGATIGKTKLDFQYDMKSAANDDLSLIFNKLFHQDYTIGAETKIENLKIELQTLINIFGDTDFTFEDQFAGEIKLSWSIPNDNFGTTVGYRYTGLSSELLYGENDDALGDKGTQRILLDLYTKSIENIKLGLDTETVVTTKTADDGAIEFEIKPYADIDFSNILPNITELNIYSKLKYNLLDDYKYINSDSPLVVTEVGAKLNISEPVPGIINNIDMTYGLNNSDDEKVFNTLITTFRMVNDLSAELGLGIRTVRDRDDQTLIDNNNLLGFSLGGSWKVPVRKIKSPLLYTAFVYNMDPYDDGTNSLAMEDFVTTDGVDKSDGYAEFRLMMKWDF